MRPPTARALPQSTLAAAQAFARCLGGAGHRAWLVGGVVRDIVLDHGIVDVDFASAALPEDVEALFPRAVGVGRRFGTVVVPLDGLSIEHTTFRTEGAYTDGRRPDQLDFGESLEDDAARRDFTCNALYLDPLDDELRDPTGGMGDLARGVLRAVGEPAQRFREDGLRLLRLARFAGRLGLEVDPDTLAGARGARQSLAGLSAERVLAEWTRIAAGPGAPKALEVLCRARLLEFALPGAIGAGHLELGLRAKVAAELAASGSAPLGAWMAALCDPGPPWDGAGRRRAEAALLALKPSRNLVRSAMRHLEALENLVAPPDEAAWERRARLAGELAAGEVESHWALARARAQVLGAPVPEEVEALGAMLRETPPAERDPAPLVAPTDCLALGFAPGPGLAAALRALRHRQLGGLLTSHEQALVFARELLGDDVAPR